MAGVVPLERELPVAADRDRMQVVEEPRLDAGIEPPADLRRKPGRFGRNDLQVTHVFSSDPRLKPLADLTDAHRHGLTDVTP